MKKNTIAVCDSEAEYACNLTEYFNGRRKLPLKAEAFTDVEKLCRYAETHPPDILLISETDMQGREELFDKENTLILSEERKEERKYIYKYQSAESVMNEIMTYFAETEGADRHISSLGKLKVLGVYSPIARCGKTMFSLTAGQILAENREVLYVNMEGFSGFPELFRKEYGRNLSDLFYDIRCGGNFTWKIENLAEHAGRLDYIPPAVSPEDIREIRFSEWVKLFDIIRKESKYQVLILDIDQCVDQLFRILDLCSGIFMPVLNDRISRCKADQFQKLWDDWRKEEKPVKEICLTENFHRQGENGFPESLVLGRWGSYVRKVLSENGEWIQ